MHIAGAESLIDLIELSDASDPTMINSSFNGTWLSACIIPFADKFRGGDWCESYFLSQDVIALSIGDICGHGIEKFASMVLVREIIRCAARKNCTPAEILMEVNAYLCRPGGQEIATAIFGLLNLRERSLTFSNAGHPPPLIAGSSGIFYLSSQSADLPLGIMPNYVATTHIVGVPAATLLVFYTDGVTEHDRHPLQGNKELCNAVARAYDLPTKITANDIGKTMFSGGASCDDAAILTAWTSKCLKGSKLTALTAQQLSLIPTSNGR